MRRNATVVDVARIAGVGASTVSRFLRGVNISKKAAAKVEQAIRETGYQPDESARALRLGRSQTLGVIVPKVTNAFFGQAVQLMEERAREIGYSLMLFTHMDHPEVQVKQLAALRRSRVDGVLLTAAAGTTMEHVRHGLGETPVVAFDALFSTQVDTVVLQNGVTAQQATAHLWAHGYRRIAIVGAKPNVLSFKHRIAGYVEFMQSRSLQPELIMGEDYDQLRYMLRSRLNGPKPPEALLSISDFATYNVIRVFDEMRSASKAWIPLLGFDDFSYAPFLTVPVTVIRQPIEEMVRASFRLLLPRIENPSSHITPEHIEIPGELVRRRSCGCA